MIEDGADLILLRLESVLPPEMYAPAAAPLREALGQEVMQGLTQDVLTQFTRAVEAQVGLSINQAAINTVHTQMQ